MLHVPVMPGLDLVPTVMPLAEPCWFTSVGMFIIDENKYPLSFNKEPEINIIGGALTYAVVGARMVATAINGTRVGGIVDKGNDFPLQVERELQKWGTGLVYRYDPTRKTTRGVNNYLENGIREFYYETVKKRVGVLDILQYDNLLHSKSFHLICGIERASEVVTILPANLPAIERPIFIWEPLPDDCTTQNYAKLCQVLSEIDIFTPNLIEAQNFITKSTHEMSTEDIPDFVSKYFVPHMKKSAVVVLRCGPRGCYVRTVDRTVDVMVPAYHSDQNFVKDPTGGGNLFCGGFMLGYLLLKNWISAAICGNLVSGCVIEQLGVPELSDKDIWNGSSMKQRLQNYNETYKNFSKETSLINWF